jgi:hypothetical protein
MKMGRKFDSDYIKELAKEMSRSTSVSYEDIPKYDLFLSQVIDYLNDKKRFIIVKQVENITIPKELELLVKQKIVEIEIKTEKRKRSIIRSLSIAATLIIIICVFTVIQFVV